MMMHTAQLERGIETGSRALSSIPFYRALTQCACTQFAVQSPALDNWAFTSLQKPWLLSGGQLSSDVRSEEVYK